MPRSAVTLALALALASAPSAASAYTYWRPVEEAVLYDGPARVVAASVAFGHLNDPRVALTTVANEAPRMRVAVRDRESGAWRVLPVPNGELVRGWPDVAWVVASDHVLSPWTRAVLGPQGFGAPQTLGRSSKRTTPVLPGGRRDQAVARDARGRHLLYADGHDGPIELSRDPAVLERVIGDDDATWALVRKGDVVRGKKVPGRYRFAVPDVARYEVALGRDGVVAFAALTTYGTLQLLDPARGYERLPNAFGAGLVPSDARCAEAPCEIARRTATLDDVTVLKKKHAALVWTQTSTRVRRRCTPPTDEGGDFACEEETLDVTRDPRIWWTADVASGRESLAPALGWELAPSVQDSAGDYPRQVLAAAADFNGDLHLVVREKVGRRSRVRWLRLDFEGYVKERAVGAVSPWSGAVDVALTGDAGLAYAGVARLDGADDVTDVPLGAETAGAAAWGVELDGLDPGRPAAVTVELTMPAEPACGTQGIALFHGDRGAAVHLRPDAVELVDGVTYGKATLPAGLVGRHRVTLEVGADGARVLLDGGLLGTRPLSVMAGPEAVERARIGQLTRCPSPGAAIVWHRVVTGPGPTPP